MNDSGINKINKYQHGVNTQSLKFDVGDSILHMYGRISIKRD